MFRAVEFSVDEMRHTSRSESAHSQEEPATGGQHARHDRHAGHSVARFRDKFLWTLIFTILVAVVRAQAVRKLAFLVRQLLHRNHNRRILVLEQDHQGTWLASIERAPGGSEWKLCWQDSRLSKTWSKRL
jgi:hypothetical protein